MPSRQDDTNPPLPARLLAMLREHWLWWLVPILIVFGGLALFIWWTQPTGSEPFVY